MLSSFFPVVLFGRNNERPVKRPTKKSLAHGHVYASTVLVTDDQRLERSRVFSLIRP